MWFSNVGAGSVKGQPPAEGVDQEGDQGPTLQGFNGANWITRFTDKS
jgi:hypothetical protein